ncbi:MAG: CBS domain-containing protein [Planctomycetaceae bacterium]|nr:CBS domain-containing protein [Planctomycetaceae bacterium]
MANSNPPPIPDDEFSDPLENYDAPVYADPLEEALATRTVTDLAAQPCETISADTSIAEALKKLASIHHACLLVEDEGRLAGLFTDRDLLDRVVLEFEDCRDQPLRTVMTPDPVYVSESDCPAAVLAVMAVSGFRHVPVLDADGMIAGIVSPRRITEFLLEHSPSE